MDIISQDLNFEPPESREEFEKKFFNFKIDSFERVFCRIENYISRFSSSLKSLQMFLYESVQWRTL